MQSNRVSSKHYKYTKDNVYLTDEQRDFYEENGYIVIRNLVDWNILDQCKQRFIDVCNNKNDDAVMIVMKDTHLKTKNVKGEYVINKNVTNKAYHGALGVDHLPTVNLTMEKGDTVFFHPVLLHGSGHNITKGFRKSISCHYADSNCYSINLRGTLQEEIEREVLEVAEKKGMGDISFHVMSPIPSLSSLSITLSYSDLREDPLESALLVDSVDILNLKVLQQKLIDLGYDDCLPHLPQITLL
ncbi:hypothetical protein FQR65_LT13822 [Abscondita terminalis]|nr:hypothetical protein FQR65_LT13822 [Abscondita terminalis]